MDTTEGWMGTVKNIPPAHGRNRPNRQKSKQETSADNTQNCAVPQSLWKKAVDRDSWYFSCLTVRDIEAVNLRPRPRNRRR